ncbi:MAG: polysaccharide biosynthesis/export family protein [Candidatus Eisenbacteria bacterium]
MIRSIVRYLVAVSLGLILAIPALAGQADSTSIDWSRVPEYRIVPGDKLAVNMGPRNDGTGDMVREQKVRPDGRITLFPVGDVVAAGLTPMELQISLVALLSAELRQPRVTVEVVEPAGNVVHVLGRVDKPGSYPAGPFVTVMQAITAAGGLKDDAARNSVLVFHRDGARTVAVTRVRLDRLLKGDDLEDLPVSKFDIVFVPRSTIGNIGVFVQQFFGPTSQVLASAFTGWELFNLDRVFVTRVVAE